MMYVPDSQLIQDEDEDLDREHHVGASHANQEGRDRHPSEPGLHKEPPPQTAHVIISTTKVNIDLANINKNYINKNTYASLNFCNS